MAADHIEEIKEINFYKLPLGVFSFFSSSFFFKMLMKEVNKQRILPIKTVIFSVYLQKIMSSFRKLITLYNLKIYTLAKMFDQLIFTMNLGRSKIKSFTAHYYTLTYLK